MKYLILGGNGYLGSKVAEELLKSGNDVVCTKRDNSNMQRVRKFQDEIKWIPATLEAIENTIKVEYFDCVINMVCNYGRDEKLYGGGTGVLDANIVFPLKVLNLLVEKSEVKNFLTIGTGLPDELNMYSFSKSIFNEFGRFYSEKQGINFTVLLLEMFYGSDESEDRFLPSIIRKMINGEAVNTTVGTQRRDVISIDDVIVAIKVVLNASLSGYNEIPVGTGVAPTISEIVDFIWDETGRKSIVNKGGVIIRKSEPDCVADTSAIAQIAKWNPVDWKTGLKKMIETIENSDCRR